MRKIWIGTVCSLLLVLGAGPSARAAAPEPELIIGGGSPLPGGGEFNGPCGVTTDSFARLYIADYYSHAIHVFSSSGGYLTQILELDPQSGPCALAANAAGRLYANIYHRGVEAFTPTSFPPGSTTTYSAAGALDPLEELAHPTGVAVDRLSGNVYVNYRTYVAAYDLSGAAIEDGGGQPIRIGEGEIGDGHGLAISEFPGSVDFPSPTAGLLYVPDHADDTVKVYDPAVDLEDPVQTIDGSDLPGGGFASLRDSAVSVDRVTGEIYVADTAPYPRHTERPEATIRVFDPTGVYEGRLKYAIVDASPPGLAVDNSTTSRQGRVYVTSGTEAGACVIAYPPGSATSQSGPPPSQCEPALSSGDGGGGAGLSGSGSRDAGSLPVGPPAPPASTSAIDQNGNLRVAVSGRLAPKRLPRKGAAPVAVSVDGRVSTTDQSLPPQLRSLRIELNRHGHLDPQGLPLCERERIQPGSSSRALAQCRSSLVGKGSFSANITLAGQEPYPTEGKLLVFNAKERGKPVLYGHIFSSRPFATSFVIVFKVQKLRKGTYGILLNAPLPKSMDAWGRLTSLEMTLARRYRHRGTPRSYISAGCPAPKGFPGATFPLARISFAFDGGKKLSSVLSSTCKARG